MKIDDYIFERLRADAARTIAVAECEDAIQHVGIRGRLREIVIANLLAPWLPPFCRCVTGMIIEARNKPRKSTQDDILVIDPMLAPPILPNVDGPDGVFPLNSVLLRIEVKSRITPDGFRDFVNASSEVINMEFSKKPGCNTKFGHPLSILVAFKSDSPNDEPDFEFHRFCAAMKERQSPSPLCGFISAICIVENGLWFLGGFEENTRSWCHAATLCREENLVRLVAKISDFAFMEHAQRQGRDSSQSLEVGIGPYIPTGQIRQVPITENGTD
ncbi:MAG: hypothetical protein KGJ60_15270 [Verrucomicrobiota bacterium]|nr:hypothetical protein [Verrucomicrobiota bacterium]